MIPKHSPSFVGVQSTVKLKDKISYFLEQSKTVSREVVTKTGVEEEFAAKKQRLFNKLGGK